MSRYLRDQFTFHGLSSAERRSLHRQHALSAGSAGNPFLTAHHLWQLPARECQLAGVDVLNRNAKSHDPGQFAECLIALIVEKSWWDTVDMLAATGLAAAFRDPLTQAHFLPLCRQSDNLWLRRSALIFQLKYREATDVDLLFALIEENLGGQEFFINKAIGWSLRQYAKVDRRTVEQFVASRALSPLSRREALR